MVFSSGRTELTGSTGVHCELISSNIDVRTGRTFRITTAAKEAVPSAACPFSPYHQTPVSRQTVECRCRGAGDLERHMK